MRHAQFGRLIQLFAAVTTLPAVLGQVRCPAHSHCTNSQCPELLEQSFSYHWDTTFVATVVTENAVCTCDTGYASAARCIGACAVHGQVRVQGLCAQVLRLTVPDMAGQQPKGCDAGPLHECRAYTKATRTFPCPQAKASCASRAILEKGRTAARRSSS